jgi:hypothetical protein
MQVRDLTGCICTHVPQFDLVGILTTVYCSSIGVGGYGAGGMSYGYALSV